MSTLIAVVEDDKATLSLIETVLTDAGYRVAPLQQEGGRYRMEVKERPALLIVDIHIGDGMVDWRTLGAIYRDPRAESIPVIICTADSEFLRANETALHSRGYGLLRKPFDIDDLLLGVSLRLDASCAGP